MPNFAIHDDTTVINVIVADSITIAENLTGLKAFETTGQPWIDWIYVDGQWLPPRPFKLWIWDSEKNDWIAPIPYPEDGATYRWDDFDGQWVEIVTE